jgi:hypothetical protein
VKKIEYCTLIILTLHTLKKNKMPPVISIDDFLPKWPKTRVLYFIGDNGVGILNPKRVAQKLFMEIPRLFPNAIWTNEAKEECPFTIVYGGDNYSEGKPTIANVVFEFRKLFIQFGIKHKLVAIQIEQDAYTFREKNEQMDIDMIVSFEPEIDTKTQRLIHSGVIDNYPRGVTAAVMAFSEYKPYVFAVSGGLIAAQEIKYFYKEKVPAVVCTNSQLVPFTEDEVQRMLDLICEEWYDRSKINMTRLQKSFAWSIFYDILSVNCERL